MNTLEELIYYCREPEVGGALLLTGEWGCGKTYLIEHELQKALKDVAFVLRISLFGIPTIEDIHRAVRQAWMSAYYENKCVNGVVEKVKKGKELISNLEFLPSWLRDVTSIDLSSFIEIQNKIGDKSIILVFDDLERSRMDSVDVLGAINDYCENLNIHTILIANQEKIQIRRKETQIDAEIEYSDASKDKGYNVVKKQATMKINIPAKEEPGAISYPEIKEKIIRRTVKYIPDYSVIVHTVIENMKYHETEYGEHDYKEFVKECESGLLQLFAPDIDTHGRPHNIRSLKCAISDFYRIYIILCKNNFQDIDKWLYSFASYVIAYKVGIAEEGVYGTIFSDEEVRMLYPAFQTKYIFDAVKKWILHGIWDEDAINHEIEIIMEREKAETPADIVRTYRIIEVDEEVINEGFTEVLNMAYAGTLRLDEYVLFIINSCWARKYNFSLPEPIEWDKVQEGVGVCIQNILANSPEGQQVHSTIEKDNRENFTEEEWSTYQIIDDFQNGNVLMFSKNRKKYIEWMRKDALSAFNACENKRYDIFNEDMAIATAEAFAKGNNSDKFEFPSYFERMWNYNIISQDIKVNESIDGFRCLADFLEKQREGLQEANKVFALHHTDVFIQKVQGLIESLNKKI